MAEARSATARADARALGARLLWHYVAVAKIMLSCRVCRCTASLPAGSVQQSPAPQHCLGCKRRLVIAWRTAGIKRCTYVLQLQALRRESVLPAAHLCASLQLRNPKGEGADTPKMFTFDQVRAMPLAWGRSWASNQVAWPALAGMCVAGICSCTLSAGMHGCACHIMSAALHSPHVGALPRCMTGTAARKRCSTLRHAPSSTPSWMATTVGQAAASWRRLSAVDAPHTRSKPERMRMLAHAQAPRALKLPAMRGAPTRHVTLRHRHYLRVWADGHRQVVHHGGQGRLPRAAGHHPRRLQLHIRHHCARRCADGAWSSAIRHATRGQRVASALFRTVPDGPRSTLESAAVCWAPSPPV